MAQFPEGRCQIFQADFFTSQEIRQLWQEFLMWSGTIHILVNNAGVIVQPQPLDQLSEEAWDRTFQVNVKAPLILSQAVLPTMQENTWGRIINISSIGVKFGGGSSTAHYSASKSTLELMTHAFAKIGAPHNVLVNAIRAGVTDTGFHQQFGRSDLSERAQLIPLKRVASPREIAEVALFLSSEASSYMTGGIIPVAGGE